MKTIKVPQNLQLELNTKDGTQVINYSFKDFLLTNVLLKDEFGVSFELLEQTESVMKQLGSDVIEVSDQYYEVLRDVVLTPKIPWKVHLGVQILPFLRAIKDASSS